MLSPRTAGGAWFCASMLCFASVLPAADQAPSAATQPAGGTPSQSAAEPPAPATQPAEPSYNLATTPKLLGTWGGVRTELEKAGFSFAPVLISGYTQNMRGGLNTENAHDVPGIVQYNFELDFNKMKLVPGGSFFIRAIQTWNDGVKDDVGSISTPTNTWGSSGDNEILVDKWWWRQRWFDDRLELRLGKLQNIIDLFDVNAYAANQYTKFSNSFLVANPILPSTKGIGAFVRFWATDWMYVQAAAMDPDQRPTRTGFDTAFHGPCHFRGFWELGLTPQWPSAKGTMPGGYRFGTWYDPKTKQIFRDSLGGARFPRYNTGDMGFYMNFDQLVWKENANPKDKQGLGVFGRYGYAHGEYNRLEHFWSLGTQYEGLLPTRDKDTLGFGVAQAILSRQYRHEINSRADRETVYEAYYAIHVTPWLQITPDVQVITNPGGTKDGRDSIVGSLRLRILF
ncbi:MAG TPA: carbohydrate porin [Phycisphaerae bacterium]|nr:carbohydrate porin [Phycisphaerae bacterium]HOM53567.1 carbohydrate porin [Phycisphaerae bacterium]HON66518.1 carbohydrate porin [Phycisphaerae bacterium]HPP28845.1 carbohydrate porin [Phycisphaerae bacterium]HPZ97682.1 carbohydrate porin [Phycisphaerae bacterium]